MRAAQVMILITASLGVLFLTGCPSNSPSTGSPPVTTQIPQDDVSDLAEPQPTSTMTSEERQSLCGATCNVNRLVPRDDLMDVDFAQLSNDARVFSIRSGNGPCAILLYGSEGGVVKADTYNRWDPDLFAEPKNLHFTIGKSNQNGSYCVPNGSLWEKTDCQTQSPDQVLHLRRIDKPVNEEIWISTYKGWKGTLMAKKSGLLHPMACQ